MVVREINKHGLKRRKKKREMVAWKRRDKSERAIRHADRYPPAAGGVPFVPILLTIYMGSSRVNTFDVWELGTYLHSALPHYFNGSAIKGTF